MTSLRRLARRRDGERGATIVEFALIAPIVFIFIFSIMDFALLMRDNLAMEHVTRDAGRIASTNPRAGNVPGHAGAPPEGAVCSDTDPYAMVVPPSPANQNCRMQSFASLAADVVERSSSGLPKETIVDFWVYLANPEGYPSQSANWKTDTNRTMTCSPAYCVRYRWFDPVGPTPGSFRYDSGVWSPKSINACPGSFDPGAMALGIYMRVDHRGLFGDLLPTTRTLTERSVIKFEPMRPGTGATSGVCKAA